jgi:hypothetical protein
VSKVPLNASDATAISFSDWMQCRDELDSEVNRKRDAQLDGNFGARQSAR